MHVLVERLRAAVGVEPLLDQQAERVGGESLKAEADGAHDPVGMRRATGDVDDGGGDAFLFEERGNAHGAGLVALSGGNAAVGRAGAHGEHGGGVGGQHLGHFGHGHFMVVGFRHHAALAVMRHGHGTLNGEDELALELFGDAHHMLIRALAFSGHDGGMEFKADDFEQHVGDARVRAVQQRDRTARAPLPLNPENGRTFAGERLGKGLVDGGVKHLGNPEPGHRARTQFDEISSGKSHSCLLDKGMLIRWIARDAAQRAL